MENTQPEWYYSKVGDHFKQWTFEQSVLMLIYNYEHLKKLHDIEISSVVRYAQEASELRQELYRLKMQQTANPDTIAALNQALGADIPNPNEN
ncbi:MAG: hypothetical protein V4714_10845 [Bacteroidota bacterium]